MELGYTQRTSILFEDNQPCIATTKNPIISERVKHIDLKYHWIRNEVKQKNLELVYCPSADMVADILTKPLPKASFIKHGASMGIRRLRG